MARDTLASLRASIEFLKTRLADAKMRDYNEAPLGNVSMGLLNRLDEMKSEKQDEITTVEGELEMIERAYEEADSVDDRVRELNL